MCVGAYQPVCGCVYGFISQYVNHYCDLKTHADRNVGDGSLQRIPAVIEGRSCRDHSRKLGEHWFLCLSDNKLFYFLYFDMSLL